jgi:serine/threonine protein kinase
MAPEQARDTREASVASDVYSLGATLLFAATGHPPYSGASVMDVLARLATEEPDLSGLPGELSEVITACLHRVPRQRPTSSAMLVQLGDFTVAQAGPDEEHSYLPDKVMALIAEYQRSPQIGPLGEFAGERAEDATSASIPNFPPPTSPPPGASPATAAPAPEPVPAPDLQAGVKAPAGGGGCGRTWPGPAGPPSGRPWSWSASSSVPRSAARVRRTRLPIPGCPAVGPRHRRRRAVRPATPAADPTRAW